MLICTYARLRPAEKPLSSLIDSLLLAQNYEYHVLQALSDAKLNAKNKK